MDIKSKIDRLPDTSGVYLFKNKTDKIIYVGKANSLKSRVSVYFSSSLKQSPKIDKMVKEIVDVEYLPTSSEVEALILESKMIKKNDPYYNRQFKDDKSYPYIRITAGEDFPQISFHRKAGQKREDKSIYFGPFASADKTRTVIKLIRQIFRIRGCRKRDLKNGRFCLDYQIGLCSAPCANLISEIEYQKRVKEASLFLAGEKKRLLRNLYQEMKEASNHLNYEKAAIIRDRIKSLNEILKSQELKRENEYLPKKIEVVEEDEIRKGRRAISDLMRKLNLKTVPERIEAFDISNIQGRLSVGSLVVFEKGRPKKEDYRRFKVKSVDKIDDYAMLQEIVERRYKRLLSEGKKLPDLILIDGGKGQLNAVQKILKSLNLQLPVISIAKNGERIFKPRDAPMVLPPDSDALLLLQRIRDEAHRFAITYHRRIRSKELRNSELDLVPGIGPKRKRRLLEYFKGIEGIRNASTVEISKIPGFGKKIAETVKAVLEVRR